jgi:hypothetical protein
MSHIIDIRIQSKLRRLWLILLGLSLLVAGCQPAVNPSGQTTATPTGVVESPTAVPPTALPSPSATLTPTPDPTPTLRPPSIWAAPYLPAVLPQAVQLANGVEWASSEDSAVARLEVGEGQVVGQWVYALVAPFPTIPDGVTLAELKDAWQGKLEEGPFAGLPLLIDESTRGMLNALWGEPGSGAVRVLPADQLLDTAWAGQPAWGIVPFEALESRWKVLEVQGQSPLHKDFDQASYGLTVPISLSGGDSQALLQATSLTNRDPDKLTTVILTGVTALVRATAEVMRRKGLTYPGQDIGPWLREADILHINNEVPFDPKCPQPNPNQVGLVFCSRPEYIELLEDIGTDVVDLSGDHFADFGPQAMIYTLDLYNEKGIPHFGGGYTEADGRQPLLLEHNGNKIAFLGCNAKGGGYATARGDKPGAVECDYDLLAQQIADVKAEGYLPIVTVQDIEYYTYVPQPRLIEDFHKIADAAPVIVSGNQAHQPHGMEFYNGTFIHYGLGNLFFDQYYMGWPTAHAFIDRHVFYDGRYLGTELLAIRFVDYARPVPASVEDRQELLQHAFDASLW